MENKKIPLNLAEQRFIKIVSDDQMILAGFRSTHSTNSKVPAQELKELEHLFEAVTIDQGWQFHETLVRVYNAFKMYQDCGSFQHFVDIDEHIDYIVWQILNTAETYIGQYFSDIYEKNWFSCAMCGKETQLYVRKDNGTIEAETSPVKEFKNISHICGGCWENYIHE